MEHAAFKKLSSIWLGIAVLLIVLWFALDHNPISSLLELALLGAWLALTYYIFVVMSKRGKVQMTELISRKHAEIGFSAVFSSVQDFGYIGFDRGRGLFHLFDPIKNAHTFYDYSQFKRWEINDVASARPIYSMYFVDAAGVAVCEKYGATGVNVGNWRAFVNTL